MKNVTLLCLCLSAAVACGCAGNASRKKAAETASPDTLPATMVTGLGDSLAAVPDEAIRDTLHRPYTEKELDELQERIWKRLEELKETPIGRNVYMSSVMADGRLEVALMLNSPEMREEFRRLVADVPVIRLTGPTEPQLDDRVGSDDTLGLYLCPEYPVYATGVSTVRFRFFNRSGMGVTYGERYFLTFQDERGAWRRLPSGGIFNDLGYALKNNGDATFTASLYPEVNRNKPGRYRYFHEITLDGRDVLMMAEFRLSGKESEWKDAAPTAIPGEVTADAPDSRPYVEEPVYDAVEVMPRFPGGEDALRALINRRPPEDIFVEGRVIVSFIVDTDGRVSDVKIVRPLDKRLDDEALRVIREMPRWIPGMHEGRPVRVRYTLPVKFSNDVDVSAEVVAYETDEYQSYVSIRVTNPLDWSISYDEQCNKYYRVSDRWKNITDNWPPEAGRDLGETSRDLPARQSHVMRVPFYNREPGETRERDGDYRFDIIVDNRYMSVGFRMVNGEVRLGDRPVRREGKATFTLMTGRGDSLLETASYSREGIGDVCFHPDEMPAFPDGRDALFRFIRDHMDYPLISLEHGDEGTVILDLTVDAQGRLTECGVLRSATPHLDKEAVRLARSMPRWTSGRVNGRPVNVRFALPITFELK